MTSIWLAAGAICCALSIIAGAFGAHGLEARIDSDSLALWETAARYLMYGGLGLILLGVIIHSQAQPGFAWAARLLLAGTLVFSGTIFLLAVGAPRWLGAVTPLGGLGMILAFVLTAWTAFRS